MPSVIPVPALGRISEYAVAEVHACVSGDLVIVEGPKGLAGVCLSNRTPLWHFPYDPHVNVKAPEGQIRTERDLDASPWISHDQRTVVTLVPDRQLPHLVAIDSRNGKQLWEIEVDIPQEMLQWEKGIHTGWDRFNCRAKFVSRNDLLALCCTRYASEIGNPDHIQEAGESTLLVRIDPASGKLLWTSHLFGVRAGEGSINFRGPFLRGDEVGEIDWNTGQPRVVHQRPGIRAWPLSHRDGLLVASVDRGKLTIEHVHRDGTVIASAPWKRTGVRSMSWWSGAPVPILQLNQQSIVFVSDDLAPRWEAKAKPWIYGASTVAGTPVIVATNGAGGHLLAFDRETGVECMRFTPSEGGINELMPVPEARLHVCTEPRGLLCTDGHRTELVAFGGKHDTWNLLGLFRRDAVYVSSTKEMRLRLVPIPSTFDVPS